MKGYFIKKILIGVLFLIMTGSYANAAGSIRNRDFNSYNLQLRFSNGRIGQIIIPSNAVLLNPCAGPCVLTILGTGDTAQITPNDDVIITYGRMRVRKRFGFPNNRR